MRSSEDSTVLLQLRLLSHLSYVVYLRRYYPAIEGFHWGSGFTMTINLHNYGSLWGEVNVSESYTSLTDSHSQWWGQDQKQSF